MTLLNNLMWRRRAGNGSLLATTASLSLNFGASSYYTKTAYSRTNLAQIIGFVNGAAVTINNGQTDPFGGTEARRITGDGTSSGHYSLSSGGSSSVTYTAGVTYTSSCYVKMDTAQFVQITFPGASFTNTYATFDLATGVQTNGVGATSTTIRSAGNGWYRISITATAGTTAASNPLIVGMVPSGSSTRLQTSTMTESFFAYWPQIEVGAVPSSRINHGATVTLNTSTDPADVGALTFTNSSGGYAETSSGKLVWFPPNTPRITDLGILVEESRTNKCTNTNVNPQDLTNVSVVSGGGILSLVDDSAALASLGLTGNVYKIDNTDFVGDTTVTIIGTTGNTNVHSLSAYIRGGSGLICGSAFADGSSTFPASSTYQRRSTQITPSNTVRQLTVRANTGQVVYFILNQLEEGATITSPIPVNGIASTRAADAPSYSGLTSIFAYPFTIAVTIGRMNNDDTTLKIIASVSDGTGTNRLSLRRSAAGSAQVFATVGGVSQSSSSWGSFLGSAGFSMAARTTSTSYQVANSGIGTNITVPTMTNTGALGIGGYADSTGVAAGNAFNGYISSIRVYTKVLTDAELLVVASGSDILAPVTGSGDPFFSNVVLLSHMENISSIDVKGHVFTGNGGIDVSTTSPKFGTSSLLINSSTKWLTSAAHGDWLFGTGPFTVETWIKVLTNPGVGAVATIMSNVDTGAGDTQWRFDIGNPSGTPVLRFGTWNTTLCNGTTSFPTGSWVHVAASFDGTTYRQFLNGVLEGSTSTSVQNLNAASPFNIAYSGLAGTPFPFANGSIDEVRITKGVARYTANFTPPTAAFPDS